MAQKLWSNKDGQGVVKMLNMAELDSVQVKKGGKTVATEEFVSNQKFDNLSWKEVLLHTNQLYSDTPTANLTIKPAIPFFWDASTDIPVGDTLTISDGNSSVTFTFTDTPSVVTDVQTGTTGTNPDDIKTTLANLVTAINNEGTFEAVSTLKLDAIYSGGASGDIPLIVIMGKPSDAKRELRIFGSFSTQANARYVNYFGESTYEKSTDSQLPSSDPGQKEAGIAKYWSGDGSVLLGSGTVLDINDTDTHNVRENNSRYTADQELDTNGDGGAWNRTDSGAVPDASTTTKGKVELAVVSEAEAKSSNTLALTPASLANFTRQEDYVINGDGTTKVFPVSHGFNSRQITVEVTERQSPYQVFRGTVTKDTTSEVNIRFDVAPSGSEDFDVVIQGK